MIPVSNLNTELEISNEIKTSKTYKIASNTIQGYIDNKEALCQWIYKILNTERYEYPIYSFSYGIDLESLIGKDADYVKIELRRRIKECLIADERIEDVNNFLFHMEGDEMYCSFHVVSIYGDFTVSKEVII